MLGMSLLRSHLGHATALICLALATACASDPALTGQGPDDSQTLVPAPLSPASSTTTPVATPTPHPAMLTTAPDGYAELRESIEDVLAEQNGRWAVAVQDLSTGQTLLIDADARYPAASQYKLLLLYQAYRQIEAGALALDQTTTMLQSDYADSLMWDEEVGVGDRVSVRGLLRVLVIQSSNAAAHALGRLMGVPSLDASVADAARRIGLSHTGIGVSDYSGRNGGQRQTIVTSARDLLQFHAMLYRGELVSKEASRAMLDLLAEQQINDRIPALLPRGVKVAHKTGNLPGVVSDGGIIFGPRGDVVLVVLSDGADYEPGTEAIGRIARLVYDWHSR